MDKPNNSKIESGSAIIDNLSIQGALMAVIYWSNEDNWNLIEHAGHRNTQLFFSRESHPQVMRDVHMPYNPAQQTLGFSGWDESRLSFDMLALSTLLQSIIVHDRLYFFPDYAATWKNLTWGRGHLHPRGGETVQCLAEFLLPLEVSFSDNLYLGTMARDAYASIQEASNNVTLNPVLEVLPDLAESYDQYYLGEREPTNAPWFQQMRRANEDPAKILNKGAIYYYFLSRYTGLPVVPHPMRSAFLQRFFGTELPSERPAAHIVIEHLEASANHIRGLLSQELGNPKFEIPIPSILPTVIQRASSTDDIIPAAFEIRAGRAATDFREYMNEVDNEVANENYSNALRMLADAKRLSSNIVSDLAGEPKSITLGISLGPVGFSKEFSLPDKFGRSWPGYRKGKAAFLYDLAESMIDVRNMQQAMKNMIRSSVR